MTVTDTENPADEKATMNNVRVCILVFLTSAALFALFGSDELVSMSYDLPENAWTLPVVALAEAWHVKMQAIGTVDVSLAVRDFVAGLRAVGWP